MSKAHRDYFNRIAPEWNEKMPDDPIFRDFLIRFGVSPGDRVMDIGAGTGRMTKYLIELVGDEGMVVCEDIAELMLEEGKHVLRGKQPYWLCDDVMALSIKENTFDKVICFSAFPHFVNPISAIKEIHRILQPGGSLLILHTCSSNELNEFHASLDGVVSADTLPTTSDLASLLQQFHFIIEEMTENDNLYWIQSQKAHKPITDKE